MQITDFCTDDFESVERLMSFCTQNARRELEEYLENPYVKIFVAKQPAVTGFAALLFSEDFADILDIAVNPLQRRHGTAKKLLEHSFDICKARGVKELFLEVRRSNSAANALYRACGFEQISVRKNYYSAPREDALIYRIKT